MTWPSLLQYVVFLAIVTLCVKPIGGYLTRVFSSERTLLDLILRPLERVIYRSSGIDPDHEMDWKGYASAFIRFTALGTVVLYLILRLQNHLPWFEASRQTTPMTVDLALNTAVSFSTTPPGRPMPVSPR